MRRLAPAQRKYLKSLAHPLKPVVAIGAAGLSEAVLREIARALVAHELIKIRVHNGNRAEREVYLKTICDVLDAAPVQHIGKLLLIYRPAEPPRITLP